MNYLSFDRLRPKKHKMRVLFCQNPRAVTSCNLLLCAIDKDVKLPGSRTKSSNNSVSNRWDGIFTKNGL